MRTAFLFAGQGSQKVGMAFDFYQNYPIVRALYDQIKCSYDIKKITFEGPQELLDQTQYAQSSIVLASYAIAMVLKEKGIVAEQVAGLSLGEYTALTFADSFSIQDAVNLTIERGRIMQDALPLNTSGMVAVMQTDISLIEEVCQQVKFLGCCEIANYNCPGQIVITGENKALEAAVGILKSKGAKRIIPLRVSGAFHSSLLSEGADQLYEVLGKYSIEKPRIPVVYNALGHTSEMSVRDVLRLQMKSSVLFWQSIENMIADGIELFIEVGPGSTLKNLVRKINSEVKVYHVEDIKSMEAMLGELL